MGARLVEVGIGLALTFFAVAFIASAVVEAGARLFRKRANDLETTITALLGSPTLDEVLRETSVYRALRIGSGGGKAADNHDAKPSYIPATAFADAAIEMLARIRAKATDDSTATEQLVTALGEGPFGARVDALVAESKGDLTAIKAGIESWFDASMARLQGKYERDIRWWLFGVGLALAAVANISAVTVTQRLWTDTVVREAVVANAAARSDGEGQDLTSADLEDVAEAVQGVEQLGLPIGWTATASPGWDRALTWHLLGIVATALAAMLGAPFWFDVMKKLSEARTGMIRRPLPAADDATSASRMLMAAPPSHSLDDAFLADGVLPPSRSELVAVLAHTLPRLPPVETPMVRRVS